MATRTTVIKLPLSFAGLTLKAQPVDAAGVSQGSPITTGFVDQGDAEYQFTTNSPYVVFKILNAADDAKLTIASIDDPSNSSTVNLVVTPITAQVIVPAIDTRDIVLDQSTATTLSFSAVDGAGDALDLEGHDIQFFIFLSYVEDESIIFTIPGEVNAEDSGGTGTVTVPITTTHTAKAQKVNFALRDLTADIVISKGTFDVRALPGGG